MAAPGTVPARTLAGLFEVSERRIQQLARDGVIPRPQVRGQYPLAQCVQAYVRHLRSLAQSSDNEKIENLATHRLRLTAAKADQVELENARARADLLPAHLVVETWAGLFANARAKMRAIPGRLRKRIHGLTVEDAQEIGRQIDEALRDLARADGLPRDTRPGARAGD